MPEHLSPEPLNALDPDEQHSLRALSRSPHPYHHQTADLPHPSDRFARHDGSAHTAKQDHGGDLLSPTAYPPPIAKDSPQTSDSGSEADDEHFWKGLPAPKSKPHKGLRGLNEPLSGSSSPLPSPGAQDVEGARLRIADKVFSTDGMSEPRRVFDVIRRRRVVARRATEAGIVLALGVMVASNPNVSRLLDVWGKGMQFRFHVSRSTSSHSLQISSSLVSLTPVFSSSTLSELRPPHTATALLHEGSLSNSQ